MQSLSVATAIVVVMIAIAIAAAAAPQRPNILFLLPVMILQRTFVD